MMTSWTIDSPLGPLRLVERDNELAELCLPPLGPTDQPSQRASALLRGPAEPDLDLPVRSTKLLARAAEQLAEYFAGERRTFELPLAPHGSEFQARVWRALLAIPFGATCSYVDIARAIGQPSASRAVGTANGRNPIAIIVPCHRVIGANGTLTGYGGGLPTKRWLLDHERRAIQPGLFPRSAAS